MVWQKRERERIFAFRIIMRHLINPPPSVRVTEEEFLGPPPPPPLSVFDICSGLSPRDRENLSAEADDWNCSDDFDILFLSALIIDSVII